MGNDRESIKQTDRLENSVFVAFKDCLVYYFSTAVSLAVKAIHESVYSSLKQLMFMSMHMHCHTHTYIYMSPITLSLLRAEHTG